MAFVLSDRVKETTTTTGTGAVTLAGAVSGFEAFSARMANADTTRYCIQGGAEWEVGIGTWNTGGTLTRTTVLKSSNGDAAVNLSAGTKNVFMTIDSSLVNRVKVRAYRDAALSIGTEADIVFDVEDWDKGANFNTTTGVFTAPVQGYYDVFCTVRISNLGDGTNANLRLYGNGVATALTTVTGASAGGDPSIWCGDTIFLAAGQTIKATLEVAASRALSVGQILTYITINYLGE